MLNDVSLILIVHQKTFLPSPVCKNKLRVTQAMKKFPIKFSFSFVIVIEIRSKLIFRYSFEQIVYVENRFFHASEPDVSCYQIVVLSILSESIWGRKNVSRFSPFVSTLIIIELSSILGNIPSAHLPSQLIKHLESDFINYWLGFI